MATQHPATGFAVRVERTYAAPPEKVFDAFTQAEALKRWFSPSDDYTVRVLACEPRVGGRYRIEMQKTGADPSVVGGVYELVDRPTRLAFSWQWETSPEHGQSRVTVSFESAGSGTRLVLVQEQLPSEESRTAHMAGWNGCLERLSNRI